MMEYLKMQNLIIRNMTLDDIQYICEADGDTSEENIKYLQNQIGSQDEKRSQALLALYNGKIGK